MHDSRAWRAESGEVLTPLIGPPVDRLFHRGKEAISARFNRDFCGWNPYGKWLETAHTILAVGQDVCADARAHETV